MSTARLDPLRPSVPDVLGRFGAYRARPGNEAWGSLHIVLDDMNTGNESVSFCESFAREKGDEEGAALAQILLRMSRTQRAKIASSV